MEKRNKTYIDDLDRGVYDIKNDFNYDYKSQSGLTEEIVREISEKKNEPEWMLKFRLESL
ncbi:MAG TPA: Fe-S cluster assembly protein SufB, partial [Clostridiaceae bacterium]|nr:Fe-S cluster assembly protein SufB [Clostridiaceae bacterium]